MKHQISARCPAQWVVALIAVAVVGLSIVPTADAQQMRDMIHSKTLDNGLEVVVLQDTSVPLVTIELTLRHGAFAEAPEYDGLSHLYEHMFFKGNEQIPNQEAYMERMRELGMVFNGTTSAERVNYFFTLPVTNLAEGLEFMYDATTSPLFDEDEFESEKDVVVGESDRAESNPGFWLRKAVNEELWYEHPHRKSPLGEMDVVRAATIAQMEHILETYYVPNNSVVMVAGDVEPEEAFAAVEAQFGQWERGQDPFEIEPVPDHPPLQETSTVLVEETVQVPMFQIAWHGPSVTDDPAATYAADVLLYILQQPGSQFQQNLVQSRIALGASKSYYTQRFIGPSSVSVRVQPENLRDAIRATLLEVEKFADPDYYTDEQLQSAKTILAVNDIYSREKTSSFTRTLTFWWAVAELDYYLDFIPNIQAVTREDIANYVNDYIIDEHFVLGVLLSPEQLEELDLTAEELADIVEEVQQEIQDARHNDADNADEQEATNDTSADDMAHSHSDEGSR